MTNQASLPENIVSNDLAIDTPTDAALLEIARTAVFTLDSTFRIKVVSSSIVSLLGYQAADLIGKSYIDLVAIGFQEAFNRVLITEEKALLDYPLTMKNGDWCWVRHAGQQIRSKGAVFYRCLVQDVSHYKQPRDEVERERNLLHTIINNIPDAIHATDEEGRYVFSNPSHAKMVGRVRPADVLGLEEAEVLSPEQAEEAIEEDVYVMQKGKMIVDERRLINSQGQDKWLIASKLPMRNAQGHIIGVIGITRDISTQRRSQARLAHTELRQRALLEAMPDLVVVLQRDGKITEFHGSEEVASLGLDASIVGLSIHDLKLPEAMVDEALLYMRLALETGNIQSFEFGINKETEDEDTDTTDTEESSDYYELRMVALNEDEVLVLVRNITPLKRIQDELSRHIDDLTIVRQVNMELSANLNFNYVVKLALDAALRLSNAQSGYLVMVELGGLLSLLSVIGEYNTVQIQQMLTDKKGFIPRVLRTQEPELLLDAPHDPDYIELLADTKAVMVIPLLSNERLVGVLVLEAKKSERFSLEQFQFLQLITGRIAAFLDNANLYRQTQEQLTELQVLYDEVRHLEQLKTDMIRIASHDLKNPLAGVMGYMEMLRMDIEDQLTPQQIGYLDRIDAAARKMQHITTGILSLERIRQLSERQTREAVDLNELLRRSIVEQMDFAVSKVQIVQHNLPEESVIVYVDPLQLYEALINIINNAIKYTPQEGFIDIDLWVENEIAKVRIRDTGYGIPEDQQARLFTPFFRARMNETKLIEGTGLGLHLVKNIIERHDGKMYFESRYGEGSIFGFDLPMTYNHSKETLTSAIVE
jgi:PAS domain S-box-containing protein